MKKIITFFAALAAVLSCSKENPNNYNPVDGTYSVTLTASAPGADTKTTLVDGEGTKYVHWSNGDAIKVLLFPNRSNGNTVTGPNGVFTSHFDTESSDKAYFRTDSWSWADVPHDLYNDQRKNRLASTGIAVYPSTATAFSNKTTSSTSASLSSEIYIVLPEEQNAVVGNIESGLNFSYAEVNRDSFINTVDKGSKTELKFKNACALIQLTMPSEFEKEVTSITISSNNEVALTGKGNVDMNYYKDVILSPFHVTPEVTETSHTVTLAKADGTPLEAGAKYYVVVWPGEHESGLTIEFFAEDGTVATMTTGKAKLEASHVKPYTFNKGLVFESAAPKEYDYVYADGSQGNEVRNDIVGVVIFHGNPKTEFNDSQLPDKYCNGLAISVSSRKCAWNSESISVPGAVKTSGSSNDNIKGFDIGGYTVKNAYGANNYTVFDNGSAPNNTSGWYLGTPKEWNFIYEKLDNINALLDGVGETINPTNKATSYWLPIFYNAQAICVYFSNNGLTYDRELYYHYPSLSSYCYYARPIFAF